MQLIYCKDFLDGHLHLLVAPSVNDRVFFKIGSFDLELEGYVPLEGKITRNYAGIPAVDTDSILKEIELKYLEYICTVNRPAYLREANYVH